MTELENNATQVEEEILEQEVTQEEPTEEIEIEEELEEEEIEEKPSKSDSVPLAKYMAERKKRQEMEAILAQQEADRQKVLLKHELLQRGWPEYEADIQANKQIEEQTRIAKIEDRLIESDIEKLARSDVFFADAETYATEIKAKMRQFGISPEEAYMLIRGKHRTHEVQLQKEQLAAAKRKQSAGKKVENATTSAPKNPYPLDDADKKALKELQKAMPDSNWTPEKYFKMMKQT